MEAGATCYLVNVPYSRLHGQLPDEDVCKTVYRGVLWGIPTFRFRSWCTLRLVSRVTVHKRRGW